jgi:hypothetical protein
MNVCHEAKVSKITATIKQNKRTERNRDNEADAGSSILFGVFGVDFDVQFMHFVDGWQAAAYGRCPLVRAGIGGVAAAERDFVQNDAGQSVFYG